MGIELDNYKQLVLQTVERNEERINDMSALMNIMKKQGTETLPYEVKINKLIQKNNQLKSSIE